MVAGHYSAYNSGFGMGRCPWDARASVVGAGVQVTFAPILVTPDRLRYAEPSPETDGNVLNPPENNGSIPGINVVDLSGNLGGDSGALPAVKKKRKVAGTKLNFATQPVTDFPLPDAEST